MSWQTSFRVLVMVNPGKAKGGSLMIVFLTMVSDIHRHSVAALPFDPVILHKVRKTRENGSIVLKTLPIFDLPNRNEVFRL